MALKEQVLTFFKEFINRFFSFGQLSPVNKIVSAQDKRLPQFNIANDQLEFVRDININSTLYKKNSEVYSHEDIWRGALKQKYWDIEEMLTILNGFFNKGRDETIQGNITLGTNTDGNNLTVLATLGSELIVNGTFDTDLAHWSGTNWAWSAADGGKALHTAGSGIALTYDTGVTVGAFYKLTYSVVGGTTLAIYATCGGVRFPTRSYGSATYTEYFTATATTALAFTPNVSFNGAIDNVSLKVISNGALTVNGIAQLAALKVLAGFMDVDNNLVVTLSGGNAGFKNTSPQCTADIYGVTTTTPSGAPTNVGILRVGANSTVGLDIGAHTNTPWAAYLQAKTTDIFASSYIYPLVLQPAGGNVAIGTHVNAARLAIAAGTATAGTAPIRFYSGVSLTVAVAGVVEFTTDDLFFTITTGAARKRLVMADAVGGLTSGRVPYASTNGRLIDASTLTYDGSYLQSNGYKSSDGSAGASGSFTSADGKTVTVKDGLITAIV